MHLSIAKDLTETLPLTTWLLQETFCHNHNGCTVTAFSTHTRKQCRSSQLLLTMQLLQETACYDMATRCNSPIATAVGSSCSWHHFLSFISPEDKGKPELILSLPRQQKCDNYSYQQAHKIAILSFLVNSDKMTLTNNGKKIHSDTGSY